MITLFFDAVFCLSEPPAVFEGKRPLDLVFEKVRYNYDRFILLNGGALSSLPSGVKNVEVEDKDVHSILQIIEKEAKSSEYCVFVSATSPFCDIDFLEALRERHLSGMADYTHTLGFPPGITPVIISGKIVPELTALTANDETVTDDFLFHALAKDINAFDIETVIAAQDARIYRYRLDCNNRADTLLTTGVFEDQGKDARFNDLLDYTLANRDLWFTIPALLNIELTTRCLGQPVYFPPREEEHDLEPQVAISVIESFLEINPQGVVLLGGTGDPLLAPAVREVLTFSRDREIPLYIESDLLCEEAEIKLLVESNYTGLHVVARVDATTPETYEAVHGINKLDKVNGNITALRKEGLKVYAQYVRMNENEDELEQLAVEKKLDGVIIRKYADYCGTLPDRRVVDLSPLDRIPCFHLRRTVSLRADGMYIFCQFSRNTVIGDCKNTEFSDIIDKLHSHFREHCRETYPDWCSKCDEYYIFTF